MDHGEQDVYLVMLLSRYRYETMKYVLRKYFKLGIVALEVYNEKQEEYGYFIDSWGDSKLYDVRANIIVPLS